MKKGSSTYRLTILALFIAIMIVQNVIPFLGYIPVGALDLTTIHLTVIIAGIVLGPADGALVGGVWGVITFIRAFVAPTSPLAPLVFTNPLISIMPRILVGVVAGMIFLKLKNTSLKTVGAMAVASVLASLVNTVLVLGLIFLFRNNQIASVYQVQNVDFLMPVLLATAGVNGIPEAILAGIVAPLVAFPLLKRKRAS